MNGLGSGYKTIDYENGQLIQPVGATVIDTCIQGQAIPEIRFPLKGIYFPKRRTGTVDSGDRVTIYATSYENPSQKRAVEALRIEVQDNLSLTHHSLEKWGNMLAGQQLQSATAQINQEVGVDIMWQYPDVAGSQLGRQYYEQQIGQISNRRKAIYSDFLEGVRTEYMSHTLAHDLPETTIVEQMTKGVWLKAALQPLIDNGFPRELLWWYFNGPLAFLDIVILKADESLKCITVGNHTLADTQALVDIPNKFLEFSFPPGIYAHQPEHVPLNPLVNPNNNLDRLINKLSEPLKTIELQKKPGHVYGVHPNLHSTDMARLQQNKGLLSAPDIYASSFPPENSGYNFCSAVFSDGQNPSRDASRTEITPFDVGNRVGQLLQPEGAIEIYNQLGAENPTDDGSLVVSGVEHTNQSTPRWHPVCTILKEVGRNAANFRRLTGLA